MNRLHGLLRSLTPGGHDQRVTADQTYRVLRSLRPSSPVETKKEALRSLRRKISDAVYRQLVIDSQREIYAGREDDQGRLFIPA